MEKNRQLATIDFLDSLDGWLQSLPVLSLKEVLPEPERAAVVSVDVTKGFCSSGPLASPRVARIVEPVTRLFQLAWTHGVRDFLLTQDAHDPDAVEFGAFPPHCVRDSLEAQTVDSIRMLPFFEQITVLEKNSISPHLNSGLDAWCAARPDVDTYFVVGDCTDLCTYQLAMHLRLFANAYQLHRRVIVPVDCVDTYDRPLEAACRDGGFAHPADLLHNIFLYHMALNGIQVVSRLEA